ncbi:hypothetical protein CLOM_g2556 [Closterium sp. NIES-68]|nr:hypothetical protein CLOM_g2556 [Closterium sp. NIES-68]GJP74239.1 hypothetical protein CLOP_g4855 [Closterium sp. NIES-67]
MCQHSAPPPIATSPPPFAPTWAPLPPAAAAVAAAPFDRMDLSQSAPFWSTLVAPPLPTPPPTLPPLPPQPHSDAAFEAAAGARCLPNPAAALLKIAAASASAAAAAATAAQASNTRVAAANSQRHFYDAPPSWNPSSSLQTKSATDFTVATATGSGGRMMVAPSRQHGPMDPAGAVSRDSGSGSILGKRGVLEFARFSDGLPFVAGISELHALQQEGETYPRQMTPMHDRLTAAATATAAAIAVASASNEENCLLLRACNDLWLGGGLPDEAQQQQQQQQQPQQQPQQQQPQQRQQQQQRQQPQQRQQRHVWRCRRLQTLGTSGEAGEGVVLPEVTLNMPRLGGHPQHHLEEAAAHRIMGEDSACMMSWVEAGGGYGMFSRNSSCQTVVAEEEGGMRQPRLNSAQRERWAQHQAVVEPRVPDPEGGRRKRLRVGEEEKLSALLLASHQAVIQQQREQLAIQQRQKLALEQSQQWMLPCMSHPGLQVVAAQPIAESPTFNDANEPAFSGPGKDPGAYVYAASCSGTTTTSFGSRSPPSCPLNLNLSLSLSSLNSDEVPSATAC